MLIASKYEEIYAPEIRDFIYMTAKAYTKEQILAQERDILMSLEFNITAPSAFRFLERYIKLSDSDDLIMNFARYITELSLVDSNYYKWRPSNIAASAHLPVPGDRQPLHPVPQLFFLQGCQTQGKRWPTVCQLWLHIHPLVAKRQCWQLPLQCLWPLSQDERN